MVMVQGIAEEIGLGPAIQLATVSRAGDSGLCFPRPIRGWWLDGRGGAKVGGRGEVVRVQGIAGRN